MSKFTVFDVETPNRYNNRMSAIGITVIEDGVITDDYYSLVNPETGFDYFNIQLTGINEESVCNAQSFPEVWREIEPIMSRGMIVAHNAVFDLGVLKHCLQDYGIDWRPYTRCICTGGSSTSTTSDHARRRSGLRAASARRRTWECT